MRLQGTPRASRALSNGNSNSTNSQDHHVRHPPAAVSHSTLFNPAHPRKCETAWYTCETSMSVTTDHPTNRPIAQPTANHQRIDPYHPTPPQQPNRERAARNLVLVGWLVLWAAAFFWLANTRRPKATASTGISTSTSCVHTPSPRSRTRTRHAGDSNSNSNNNKSRRAPTTVCTRPATAQHLPPPAAATAPAPKRNTAGCCGANNSRRTDWGRSTLLVRTSKQALRKSRGMETCARVFCV